MLSSVPPRRLCPCPLLSSSSLLLLHSPFKRSFVVRGGAKQASLVARKFGRPASAKKTVVFGPFGYFGTNLKSKNPNRRTPKRWKGWNGGERPLVCGSWREEEERGSLAWNLFSGFLPVSCFFDLGRRSRQGSNFW